MNWVNFWTCRKFLGRRFCTFDMFWRLAFSIGGICYILSRVAVHIKAVCIRMNSRKVCKSSLQAFSVTCDFFDEPGNLPLIKKILVICVLFRISHCIHCWTIEPSSWTSLKFVQPFPFRRYYSLCPNFLPGFESTWLTPTTGLRTGCRSRSSWIGRRSSVAGFGPFPPLPCCWFSKGWFQTKKIYTKVGLGSELFFYDVYSKLWKSGPVMFFLVDCLSLELHGFGCFFYPWKRVLSFKQDCLKNWGAMVRVQGKDLIHAYFQDFVFSMF